MPKISSHFISRPLRLQVRRSKAWHGEKIRIKKGQDALIILEQFILFAGKSWDPVPRVFSPEWICLSIAWHADAPAQIMGSEGSVD